MIGHKVSFHGFLALLVGLAGCDAILGIHDVQRDPTGTGTTGMGGMTSSSIGGAGTTTSETASGTAGSTVTSSTGGSGGASTGPTTTGGTGGMVTFDDVAFDAVSQGSSNDLAVTIQHTCSGSNRILLVIVGDFTSGGNITGVKYDGNALAPLGMKQGFNTKDMPTNYAYAYYLIAPPLGTHDIVATRASASSGLDVAGISYSGVSQDSFPDALSAMIHNDNPSPGQTLACGMNMSNCWFVLGGVSQRNYSAGAGSTLRTAPDQQWAWFDSNGPQPAGDYSMTVALSGVAPARVGAEFMIALPPAKISSP